MQVLWTNLANMLQQLLSTTVLDSEDTISNCLTLAGALSEQAANPASSNSSKQEGHNQTARGVGLCSSKDTASSACKMLEYAAELLQYCRNQAEALQQQQQQQAHEIDARNAAESLERHMVMQHISSIQQQVGAAVRGSRVGPPVG